MKSLLLGAALMALLPAAASAQSMTVDQFLTKANALKAKGVMALGSSDLKLLRNHMMTVAADYRRDIEGARIAGKAPHSCPPPKGKGKLGSKELLAEFEGIPPARRSVSTKAAFYEMMRRRYPCK
ncbi:hypothetical protein [Sphingomonas sp. AX6]|uniref:hypothetical protein n=1 Tax=Sphingomonas sp. AX6 TaxID=2653171 RepID=UPI001F1FAEB8|nr:hypothetical protein [Sphingomonas sp. AX6]